MNMTDSIDFRKPLTPPTPEEIWFLVLAHLYSSLRSNPISMQTMTTPAYTHFLSLCWPQS